MALIVKHTKKGLRTGLKSAGMKLPHGYDIKKRKTKNKSKTRRKK